MAKIKPAGGKKDAAGPKNPGAVGCLVLVGIIFLIIGIVLYYSIAKN